MKIINLILILMLLAVFCNGQNTDTLGNKICLDRGHIIPNIVTSTALYCPPYLIETDSVTVMVYPSCNTIGFKCVRCNELIHQPEKERRYVIWSK